jgi:hypothetical protein
MSFAAAQRQILEATVALIEIEDSVMSTSDDALLHKLDVLWGDALTKVRDLMVRAGVREIPREAATEEIERRANERRVGIAAMKARRARDADVTRVMLAS